MTAVVPSVVTFVFFLTFFTSSKVTLPVGTPLPGDTGSISAVRTTDTTFRFFMTECGTRTICVLAWVTDTELGPDCTPARLVLPLYAAVIDWVPTGRFVVESTAWPAAFSATVSRRSCRHRRT